MRPVRGCIHGHRAYSTYHSAGIFADQLYIIALEIIGGKHPGPLGTVFKKLFMDQFSKVPVSYAKAGLAAISGEDNG